MEFKLNQYHRNITDDELLEDLKLVYKKFGYGTLSHKKYRENSGQFGANIFRKRFGSWSSALQLCEIPVTTYQLVVGKGGRSCEKVDTEALLKDIAHVAMLLGKESISRVEYSKYGKFSLTTCNTRFSSWDNALNKAGLPPCVRVSSRRSKDEDLLREIETVWIRLGRQPTATDIKNGVSKYSFNTYRRHFGGWRGALNTFVEYINNDTEDIVDSTDTSEHIVVDDTPLSKATKSKATSRDINLRLRFKVMQRDNFKCMICGASPATNPTVKLHIDHIIPWSKGGETIMENLQTLCSDCNLGKSDLDM